MISWEYRFINYRQPSKGFTKAGCTPVNKYFGKV